MTTLYLVRHGQSVANAEHLFAGWANFDLTGDGVLQAERTAKELADVPFSAIYSSDLLRAYRTAEPHLNYHPLEIFKNDGLREIYVGEFEGQKSDDIHEKYGDLFPEKWRQDYGNYAFPGGESVASASARLNETLTQIALAHDGETVLVTSHAGILRGFWGIYVMGLGLDELAAGLPFPTNASYSVTEFTPDGNGGGRFAPVKYSCDEHLGDLLVVDMDAPTSN